MQNSPAFFRKGKGRPLRDGQFLVSPADEIVKVTKPILLTPLNIENGGEKVAHGSGGIVLLRAA